MTDLETLRSALQEPPPDGFTAPDLTKIMADGTRIRRRRRLATGGGIAAVAVVVIVVLVGAGRLGRPGPAIPPAAAPTLSIAAPPTSVSVPGEKHTRLGDVVKTGISDPAGELVLYAVVVDVPAAPKVHFAVMAGTLDAAGDITDRYIGNQTSGSGQSPGFHSLNGTVTVDDSFVPTFGYFVGAAKRITTTVHGNTVEAHLAQWSGDSQVKFFWFTQQDVPDSNLMTPPNAYNAANQLIAGGK
jgi:hypothetical protein